MAGWLVTTMRIFILLVLIECASLLESHLREVLVPLLSASSSASPPRLRTMNSLMNFSLLHNKHPTARSCEVYKEHRFHSSTTAQHNVVLSRLLALLFFSPPFGARNFFIVHIKRKSRRREKRNLIQKSLHFYRFFCFSSQARLIFRTERSTT
jgi:hypothetical protein